MAFDPTKYEDLMQELGGVSTAPAEAQSRFDPSRLESLLLEMGAEPVEPEAAPARLAPRPRRPAPDPDFAPAGRFRDGAPRAYASPPLESPIPLPELVRTDPRAADAMARALGPQVPAIPTPKAQKTREEIASDILDIAEFSPAEMVGIPVPAPVKALQRSAVVGAAGGATAVGSNIARLVSPITLGPARAAEGFARDSQLAGMQAYLDGDRGLELFGKIAKGGVFGAAREFGEGIWNANIGESAFNVGEDGLSKDQKALNSDLGIAYDEAPMQGGAMGLVALAAQSARKVLNPDEINRIKAEVYKQAGQRDRQEVGKALATFYEMTRGATDSVVQAGIYSAMGAGPVGMAGGFGLSAWNEALTSGQDAGFKGSKLHAYAAAQGGVEFGWTALFGLAGRGGFESVMGKGASRTVRNIFQSQGARATLGHIAKAVPKHLVPEIVEETIIAATNTWLDVQFGMREKPTPEEFGKELLMVWGTTALMMGMAGAKTAPRQLLVDDDGQPSLGTFQSDRFQTEANPEGNFDPANLGAGPDYSGAAPGSNEEYIRENARLRPITWGDETGAPIPGLPSDAEILQMANGDEAMARKMKENAVREYLAQERELLRGGHSGKDVVGLGQAAAALEASESLNLLTGERIDTTTAAGKAREAEVERARRIDRARRDAGPAWADWVEQAKGMVTGGRDPETDEEKSTIREAAATLYEEDVEARNRPAVAPEVQQRYGQPQAGIPAPAVAPAAETEAEQRYGQQATAEAIPTQKPTVPSRPEQVVAPIRGLRQDPRTRRPQRAAAIPEAQAEAPQPLQAIPGAPMTQRTAMPAAPPDPREGERYSPQGPPVPLTLEGLQQRAQRAGLPAETPEQAPDVVGMAREGQQAQEREDARRQVEEGRRRDAKAQEFNRRADEIMGITDGFLDWAERKGALNTEGWKQAIAAEWAEIERGIRENNINIVRRAVEKARKGTVKFAAKQRQAGKPLAESRATEEQRQASVEAARSEAVPTREAAPEPVAAAQPETAVRNEPAEEAPDLTAPVEPEPVAPAAEAETAPEPEPPAAPEAAQPTPEGGGPLEEDVQDQGRQDQAAEDEVAQPAEEGEAGDSEPLIDDRQKNYRPLQPEAEHVQALNALRQSGKVEYKGHRFVAEIVGNKGWTLHHVEPSGIGTRFGGTALNPWEKWQAMERAEREMKAVDAYIAAKEQAAAPPPAPAAGVMAELQGLNLDDLEAIQAEALGTPPKAPTAPPKANAPRPTPPSASDVAKAVTKATGSAADALAAFFENEAPSRADQFRRNQRGAVQIGGPAEFVERYRRARPLFQAALREAIEAGKTAKEFLVETFRRLSTVDGALDYVKRFVREVQEGTWEQPLEGDAPVQAQEAETQTDEAANRPVNPNGPRLAAQRIKAMIDAKQEVTWRTLKEIVEETFGARITDGVISWKDAYDAVELAVNQKIRETVSVVPQEADASWAKGTIAMIERDILAFIPTQTRRTEETDNLQQFSTPPHYAFAAAWVAAMNEGDVMLEPSAGIGGIATMAMNAGARVVANEISPRRSEFLSNLGVEVQLMEDGEQMHNILPAKGIVPSVVVMNPPFSRAGTRMGDKKVSLTGARHVESALKALAPGGRLVAIVGRGMSMDAPTFRPWWVKIGREYNVRANVAVSGDVYRKYGTSFDTRVLVIDKTPPTGVAPVEGEVSSVSELISTLEQVRNERPTATNAGIRGETATGPRGQEARPGTVQPAPTDVVGAAQRPTGSARPGVRGEQRPSRPAGSTASTGDGGRVPGSPDARGTRPDDPGRGSVGTPERDAPGEVRRPEPVVEDLELADQPREVEPAQESGEEDAVFEPYTPDHQTIKGAVAHPTPLAQSAAMASVSAPVPTYKPRLPREWVTEGNLSAAQLEAVTYAGQAHEQTLPDGTRKGFFIGDGTGVGKGREIVGIIADNWARGRKKAIWVTISKDLATDAKRDLDGVGLGSEKLIRHDSLKPAGAFKESEGIVLTTYTTLASKQRLDGGATRKARLQQLVDWVGEGFDGVLIFDEAHEMGNAISTKGTRGTSKPSEKALTGLEVQRMLPQARIVYVSATGATEVSNLSYATRLGLWGDGTSFPTVQAFISEITASGIAGMELVARDMKQMGLYMARQLAYRYKNNKGEVQAVQYARLVHELTGEQRAIYDKLAEAWQVVLGNLEDALQATAGFTGNDGNTHVDKNARSHALSAFWGANQRFWIQVITSMKMPTALRDMEATLADGKSVVIQLVNTNEAAQERQLAEREDDSEPLDLTPRQSLMAYLERAFPIYQFEQVADPNDPDRTITQLATDSQGNPIVNQEALAMRDRLLMDLASIEVPDGPLELLLNKFGPDQVAELTGRKRRVFTDPVTGEQVTESRGKAKANADADAFMAGEKRILVFSAAGGTGRSFQADPKKGNSQQRVHYVLQPGWRANLALQSMGRTHRSGQSSPPFYKLVSTNLNGEMRFTSAIASRLDQTGALTQGQRQAGSGGLFSAADNLESDYASDAVTALVMDIYHGNVDQVSVGEFQQLLGIKLINDDGQFNAEKIPSTGQFLNRLLSVSLDKQNLLFNLFMDRMVAGVEVARQNGTLDEGVKTLKAIRIEKIGESVAYTHPETGAQTKHVRLRTYNKPPAPKSFDEVRNDPRHRDFVRNVKSGFVYALHKAESTTDPNTGSVVQRTRRIRPAHSDLQTYITIGNQYVSISEEEARAEWGKVIADLPEFDVQTVNLITGIILPIWRRLNAGRRSTTARVVKVTTETGETYLGRVVDNNDIDRVLESLGVAQSAPTLTPAEAMDAVMRTNSTLELEGGWAIKRKMSGGDARPELTGPSYGDQSTLTRYGVIMERHQYQVRYYLPTGAEGEKVYKKIVQDRPLNRVVEAKAADDHASYRTETEAELRKGNPRAYDKAKREAVAALKRMLGENVDIRLLKSLFTPDGRRALGMVQGRMLALVEGKADIKDTAFHEAVHWAEDNLLTDQEYARLVAAEPDLEKRADMGMRFMAGVDAPGVKGWARLLWAKIKRRARALFGGPTTPNGVLEEFWLKLYEGGLAERTPVTPAPQDGAFREGFKAELQAVKEVRDAKGRLLAPNGKPSKLNSRAWKVVRTPSFKAWFGDWESDPANASKVVDENGEPLVVYHGTRGARKEYPYYENEEHYDLTYAPDFTVFEWGDDPGIWFSDKAAVSSDYTGYDTGYDMAPRMFPVFLNIKNPVATDAEGSDWNKLRGDYEVRLPNGKPITLRSHMEARRKWAKDEVLFSTAQVVEAFAEDVMGEGVDGFIFANMVDAEVRGDRRAAMSTVYVAIEPNQIKSVNNFGDFNPANPDIRYRVEDPEGSGTHPGRDPRDLEHTVDVLAHGAMLHFTRGVKGDDWTDAMIHRFGVEWAPYLDVVRGYYEAAGNDSALRDMPLVGIPGVRASLDTLLKKMHGDLLRDVAKAKKAPRRAEKAAGRVARERTKGAKAVLPRTKIEARRQAREAKAALKEAAATAKKQGREDLLERAREKAGRLVEGADFSRAHIGALLDKVHKAAMKEGETRGATSQRTVESLVEDLFRDIEDYYRQAFKSGSDASRREYLARAIKAVHSEAAGIWDLASREADPKAREAIIKEEMRKLYGDDRYMALRRATKAPAEQTLLRILGRANTKLDSIYRTEMRRLIEGTDPKGLYNAKLRVIDDSGNEVEAPGLADQWRSVIAPHTRLFELAKSMSQARKALKRLGSKMADPIERDKQENRVKALRAEIKRALADLSVPALASAIDWKRHVRTGADVARTERIMRTHPHLVSWEVTEATVNRLRQIKAQSRAMQETVRGFPHMRVAEMAGQFVDFAAGRFKRIKAHDKRTAKDRGWLKYLASDLRGGYVNQLLSLFGSMDGPFMQVLYRAVLNGSNRREGRSRDAANMLADSMERNGLKSHHRVDAEAVVRKLEFDGKTYEFTQAELLNLYLALRDSDQREKHLRNGFKTRRKVGLARLGVDEYRPNPAVPEELASLLAFLTSDEAVGAGDADLGARLKAVGRDMQEHLTLMGDDMNVVSNRVIGKDVARLVPGPYWPAKVERDKGSKANMAKDLKDLARMGGGDVTRTLMSLGLLNERVPHGNVMLTDSAFRVFDESVHQVASFIEMAEPTLAAVNFLTNREVMSTINEAFGTEKANHILRAIQREAGLAKHSDNWGPLSRLIAAADRNISVGVLGFLPSSALNNLLTGSVLLFNEALLDNPKVAARFVGYAPATSAILSKGDQAILDFLMEKDGLFWRRWTGDMSRVYANLPTDWDDMGPRTRAGMYLRQAQHASMQLMAMAEQNNAIRLFKAYVNTQKPGTSRNYTWEEAMERVEAATRWTQNPSTALEESVLYTKIKENPVVSLLLLPFAGQATVSSQILLRELQLLRGAQLEGKPVGKHAARVLTTITMLGASAFTSGQIQAFLGLVMIGALIGVDDEEEEKAARAKDFAVTRMLSEFAESVTIPGAGIAVKAAKSATGAVMDEDSPKEALLALVREMRGLEMAEAPFVGLLDKLAYAAEDTLSGEPDRVKRGAMAAASATGQLTGLPIHGLLQGGRVLTGTAEEAGMADRSLGEVAEKREPRW